jgi:predicted  nucleic acid-binding Zn-ribbon protein
MRTLFFVVGLAAAAQLNPVTRVVELMEGLTKKIIADGDAEQDLYDKFKCWCTKVINAKTSSIAANEARIDELEMYIDDLESGRVELTSERQELEAEIAGLEKAIEAETTMRKKEAEDYAAAKDEMDKAIAALKGAVFTLGNATEEHMPAMLVSKLEKVLKVGRGFLAKNDMSELHKILDVPTADWKKLNREATFKKKYEARSGGIQDILKDMLKTFEDNLLAATEAEDKAKADFDALMTAKKDQLSQAKQALLDKTGEKGARGEALATSKQEKEDLEAQNERDQGYLADTKSTCETRAEEWATRKKLRAGEVAAIGEAISILRSDDARDTFKKSFDSQGFFFTQLNEIRHRNPTRGRAHTALSLLKTLGKTTKDLQLTKLISNLEDLAEQPKEEGPPGAEVDEADPFKAVLQLIDDVIAELDTEEATDLKNKEECEKERMDNTQSAKVVSKEIDTNVETMDRLTEEIEAAMKTVEEIKAEIADLEQSKKDAGERRADENKEYVSAEADDTAAVGLVENAIGVLEKFYSENGLMLARTAAHVRRVKQPFVEAGEAPTPPPSTGWSEGEGYGGAKGESTGIISIMTLIKQDIEKDSAKAKKEEEEAVASYEKLVEDIDASIGAKELTKADLEGTIAADEESRTAENSTKATNEGELASIMDFLKEIAPGCDFIAMNFKMRLTNRQIEKDGLLKAKAILEGAKFE